MSFRNIVIIVFGAMSACLLPAACSYQLPMISGSGGDGAAGMGGNDIATGTTGGTAGATGMGGSAGTTGMGGNAGAGGAMPVQWWDEAWTQRVPITFQNADGIALSDFPVMVRLDPSRIQYSLAAPDGTDLRFIDDDGKTVLSYEIDRWAPGGDSYVWVRVPTIDATNTDHIWLYYGNSASTDGQNAIDVWKSFVGVYHLSPSNGTPIQFADSTGTNAAAWFMDQPGMIVPGPINDAINLDGVHFVHVGDNNNVAANPGQARTAEAWMNVTVFQYQAAVYEEGQCVGWYLGTNSNAQYYGSFITDPDLPLCMSTPTNEYSVTTSASQQEWHYVTLVVDRPGQEMRLFVDGKLATITTINNTEIADGNGVFRIGSDSDGNAGTFNGGIDEVRVSNRVRSAGWIAAQYKSMKDDFLIFNGP